MEHLSLLAAYTTGELQYTRIHLTPSSQGAIGMRSVCTLTQPTNLLPIYSLTKSNEGWPTIWTNIIKEHLLKQKPTKQVYVGSGLPTLPRHIAEKMLKWEYINFNELLPFSDLRSEEEQGLTQTPEQFKLFPGIGLLQHGQPTAAWPTYWPPGEILLPAVGKLLCHTHGCHGLPWQ